VLFLNKTGSFNGEKPSTASISKENFTKKKDIYSDTPVRLLGFTNEAGAAMAPLIGPFGEMITYGPALGYIAMDVRDKYKRGENNDYSEKSHKRATKQLIFQLLASVILPTAVVKTAQIVANKVIDKVPAAKEKIKSFANKNLKVANFIEKFSDKNIENPNLVVRFAHQFQKIIDTVTIVPRLIKLPQNKSGLRNAGLAVVGLTALAAAIKPIDKLVEHVIVPKAVDPVLYRKKTES